MRKVTSIFLILTVFAFMIYFVNFLENKDTVNQVSNLYQPPEQSREELYQDMFISLLMPHIQKEIDIYYSKTLKTPPSVAPYDIYVLNAERPNGYRSFLFRVKLKVMPYVGAHNSVGIDKISFIIHGNGKIEVEKFEHIKNYSLPPNYENLLKNNQKE